MSYTAHLNGQPTLILQGPDEWAALEELFRQFSDQPVIAKRKDHGIVGIIGDLGDPENCTYFTIWPSRS